MTQLMQTSKIKPAKYNPKGRTQKLNGLLKSIKEHGIIIPLIIDSENNLVDGHRRLESAKKLKLEHVPTIQIKKGLAADLAYEVVNTNAKRLSTGDYIYIHLHGGMIPRKILTQIELLTEIVGEDGLKRLSNVDASYRIADYAHRVVRYLHNKQPNFLKRTIFWLAENRMSFSVRRAMENRVKADVIEKAIAANRPLKPTYQ
jgi:hypothetical protein